MFYVTIKYISGSPNSTLVLGNAEISTFSKGKWIHSPLDLALTLPPYLVTTAANGIKAGRSAEGWVVSELYTNEQYPVIVVGGLGLEEGKVSGIYFAAYPRQKSGEERQFETDTTGLIWVGKVAQLNDKTLTAKMQNMGPAPASPDMEMLAQIGKDCQLKNTDQDFLKTWGMKITIPMLFNDWAQVAKLMYTDVIGGKSTYSAKEGFGFAWTIVVASNMQKISLYPLDRESIWPKFFMGWESVRTTGGADA